MSTLWTSTIGQSRTVELVEKAVQNGLARITALGYVQFCKAETSSRVANASAELQASLANLLLQMTIENNLETAISIMVPIFEEVSALLYSDAESKTALIRMQAALDDYEEENASLREKAEKAEKLDLKLARAFKKMREIQEESERRAEVIDANQEELLQMDKAIIFEKKKSENAENVARRATEQAQAWKVRLPFNCQNTIKQLMHSRATYRKGLKAEKVAHNHTKEELANALKLIAKLTEEKITGGGQSISEGQTKGENGAPKH